MSHLPACHLCENLSPEELARIDAIRSHVDVAVTILSDLPVVTRWNLRKHRSHTKPAANATSQVRNLSEALAMPPIPHVPSQRPPSTPRGTEAGVRWEKGAKTATVTLPPQDVPAGVDACATFLLSMGFDPKRYVIHPVKATRRESSWRRDVGDVGGNHTAYTDPENPLWDCEFRITERATSEEFDVEELLAAIGRDEHLTPPALYSEGESLLVGLADWQCGKRDQGGTQALVKRLAALGPQIVARVCELQAIGRNVEAIYLVGLGDLVEGCQGFYPNQTFTVELNGRQQKRVARRMLTEVVKVVASLGIPVVVSGVAGNHGETRVAGKSITDSGDNADLEVLEQVAEAFELAEGFEHVSFVVPENELFHTLNLSGRPTVFTHGHVARGGWGGLWTWFKNQRAHSNISSDATLCVVGHYHHLHVEQDGILTLLQAPALEGGSDYYTTARGPVGIPGTMTVLVSKRGVRDLAVLDG